MLPNCKTVAKPACFLRVCFQVINACRNHGRNHALWIFGNKTGVKNILDVFEISAFPCNLITQKSLKKSLRSWAASPRAGQGVGEAPGPSPSRGAAQGQHPRCGASGRGTAAPSHPALQLQPPPKPNASLPLQGLPSLDSWKTRVADNTRRGFRQWVTPLARSKSRAGHARCWVCPQEVLGACCCPSVRLSVHLHGPKTGQGQAEHCAPLLGCAGTGALSFGWPREIVHYHTQTNTPVTLLLNTAKHGSNITRTGVVLRLTTEGRKCTGVVEGDP